MRWNQAVMELGALVCTARAPRCEECPLRERHCRWFAAGRPEGTGAPARTQAFAGTDRQLRGQIMALLRKGPAGPEAIAALDPNDPERVRRCRGTLVADGLAVEIPQQPAAGAAGEAAGDTESADLAGGLRLP